MLFNRGSKPEKIPSLKVNKQGIEFMSLFRTEMVFYGINLGLANYTQQDKSSPLPDYIGFTS
jgi:hypothetical protein